MEKQGFETILAGSVRGNKVKDKNGVETVVFREKGVDVRLAVDTVSMACDKQLKTAIICSSDSDLQPAVEQLKFRNVEVIYVGFEVLQNRGLTYTADRTILIRNAELQVCYNKLPGKRKAA